MNFDTSTYSSGDSVSDEEVAAIRQIAVEAHSSSQNFSEDRSVKENKDDIESEEERESYSEDSSSSLLDSQHYIISSRKGINVQNGYVRIVFGVILTVPVVAGFLMTTSGYNTIFGAKEIKSKPKKVEKKIVREEQSEEDRMRAELAFSEQDNDLSEPPEQEKSKLVVEPVSKPQPKTHQPRSQHSRPTSRPVARHSPRPRPRVETLKDPLEEWARLASLGMAVGQNEVEIDSAEKEVSSRTPKLQTVADTTSSENIQSKKSSRQIVSGESEAETLNRSIKKTEVARVASVSIGTALNGINDAEVLPLNREMDNFLLGVSQKESYLDRKSKEYRETDLLNRLASSGVTSSYQAEEINIQRKNRSPREVKSRPPTKDKTQEISVKISNTPQIVKPEEVGARQIPFGTTVKGEISSGIVWSDGVDTNLSRASIDILEPILAKDGRVAIEAGSSLIVEVETVQNSGLVDIEVIALSYLDSSGALRQETIPEGAISIRGENDRPLIARRTNESGGLNLGQDILLGTLAAGERGFQILNEPDEDFGFREEFDDDFSGGSSFVRRRRSSSRSSLLTGAAEGAFGITKDRLESRSQGIDADRREETPIYQVKTGTPVSIFINSFLEINI